jgi:hypothetical protein
MEDSKWRLEDRLDQPMFLRSILPDLPALPLISILASEIAKGVK